jgi:hypothetical protein
MLFIPFGVTRLGSAPSDAFYECLGTELAFEPPRLIPQITLPFPNWQTPNEVRGTQIVKAGADVSTVRTISGQATRLNRQMDLVGVDKFCPHHLKFFEAKQLSWKIGIIHRRVPFGCESSTSLLLFPLKTGEPSILAHFN